MTLGRLVSQTESCAPLSTASNLRSHSTPRSATMPRHILVVEQQVFGAPAGLMDPEGEYDLARSAAWHQALIDEFGSQVRYLYGSRNPCTRVAGLILRCYAWLYVGRGNADGLGAANSRCAGHVAGGGHVLGAAGARARGCGLPGRRT